MELDTILLTGTIQVVGQPDHQIRSADIRLQQYLTNIVKYIIDSPFRNIVFCENSNHDINGERRTIEGLAKMYQKNVELLQFSGDAQKTNKQGRGYGESEIMEYAINYSKLLQADMPAVKITGRYFICNTGEFVRSNKGSNMFVRMTPFKPRCSTACYIFTPNFYKKQLRDAGKEVDDHRGKEFMLEGVFYQKLSQLKNNTFLPFKKLPKLQAITGSGYVLESNFRTDGLKNLLLSLGLYKI